MSARSMLSRLRKLEVAGQSHVLRVIGSMESFEKDINDRIAAEQMCPVDGPILIECVRRWVKHGHGEHMGNGVVESFTVRGDT
jgi:hypothetical protein